MRFFKYLVLIFVSIIPINSNAAWKTIFYAEPGKTFPGGVVMSTVSEVCASFTSKIGTVSRCEATSSTQVYAWRNGTPVNIASYVPDPDTDECPPIDFPEYVYYQSGTPIPKQTCREVGAKFCVFIDKGNRIILNHKDNQQSVVLYSKSSKAFSSCTPLLEGQCDKNDPYGGCFTPPNDGCTRQKDGSIVCPQDTSRPDPKSPCNGAAYCKRPPTGCGKGYVTGSFNGQQLCVRAGPDSPKEPDEPEPPKQPNDPNDPNDPNKCTISSCPRPDTDKECPKGYYSTYHNGQAICVLNNPNPNQPNPNDPNNKQPPDSGGEGGTDLTGVINAIRSLKDALVSSIDGVSRKLTDLTNGQKTTNDHLKNIKDESVKSNGHLDKIEDATQAASEAIGETNKKLDSVKDSIDSQTKCRDESGKYRECSSDDLKKLGDSNANIPTSEMGQQAFSMDVFRVNASNCPADKHLDLPTMFGTISKTVSFQQLCNQTSFFGYIVLILAYSFAVVIVMRA